MSTIHIEAKKEEIANLVLMPGDPDRAKYIANKYLTNVKLINSIREEYAYTGYYKNKRVTIFSSGMGIPSMGIYSYELFNNYDVDTIIRIGTAGSYKENIKVKDLFLINSSYSNSNYEKNILGDSKTIINSNEEINNKIKETAKKLNFNLNEGRTYTSENFYGNEENILKVKETYNCSVVEMETFALFVNAFKLNKKAASIVTISDSIYEKRELSSLERETTLNDMITLALESIIVF